MTTLDEELTTLREQDVAMNRRIATTKTRRVRILRQRVFPHLPKSLTTLFKLDSCYLSYDIGLVFVPINDLMDATKERALGLITKTIQTLKEDGWLMDEDPHAYAKEGPEKTIEVKIVGHQTIGKFPYTLRITFGGFDDTPNCHLVEKDVIIAAVYTPERTEKRLVVQCDEPTPEEVSA